MANEPKRDGYVVKRTVPLSQQADIYPDEIGCQDAEAPDNDEMTETIKQ